MADENFAIELAKSGNTLHYYAYTGDLEFARMTLANGADVDSEYYHSVFGSKYSALHCAAEKNDKRMIHLLVSEGADVNANLKTEGTPLHIAIKSGSYEAVEALLQYDIDIEARSFIGGKSLSTYFMSVEEIEKAKTDSRYFTGFTPLHCLAVKGNAEMIHLLLNYGADINAIHHEEGTALHRAIEFGNEDAIKALLSHDSINVNARGSRGTSLHYAALWGREDIIRLILNRGSNVDVAESNCDPELHVAFRIGYDEAVRYLSWYAAEAKCEYHIGCTVPHLPKDVYLWSKGTVHLSETCAKEKRRTVLLCFHIAEKSSNTTVYLDPQCIAVIAKHAAIVRKVGGYLEPMTDGSGPSCRLERYLKEMESMKTNRIKGSCLTYFDILTMTVHEIAKSIENYDLLQYLKSVDHCILFPMSGVMIKRQVNLVSERKKLIHESGWFFSSLTRALKLSRALPFECIDGISSYLSNDVLENLIMSKHN